MGHRSKRLRNAQEESKQLPPRSLDSTSGGPRNEAGVLTYDRLEVSVVKIITNNNISF